MNYEEIIRNRLEEILEIKGGPIELDANFIKDMGMDSLRILEIFTMLESEFSITIPPERLPEMLNLRGVITIAKEYIEEKKD